MAYFLIFLHCCHSFAATANIFFSLQQRCTSARGPDGFFRTVSHQPVRYTSAGPDGAYDKYHSQTKVEVHTLSYGPSFFCSDFCGKSEENSQFVEKRGLFSHFSSLLSLICSNSEHFFFSTTKMYKCARAGRLFPDRLTSTRSVHVSRAGRGI